MLKRCLTYDRNKVKGGRVEGKRRRKQGGKEQIGRNVGGGGGGVFRQDNTHT